MNFSKRTWPYLVAIFLAGVVTGGSVGFSLAVHRFSKPPDIAAIGKRVERQLTEQLDLDAEQQEGLRRSIDVAMARIIRSYFRSVKEIDHAVRDAGEELIDDLRPDQAERLKKVVRSRQEFIQQHSPLPLVPESD